MILNAPAHTVEIGPNSTVIINGPVKKVIVGYNCIIKQYTQRPTSDKFVSGLKSTIDELRKENRDLQEKIHSISNLEKRINDLEKYISELQNVNHRQAKKIQKLEAHEPNECIHPTFEPTKKDCETVLRMFKIYLDCEG